MERDLEWKFVLEGDPSIPLFPLVSGDHTHFNGLNPLPFDDLSISQYYGKQPTTTDPPQSFPFFSEDFPAFNHNNHQQQLLPHQYSSSSDPFNLVSETIKIPQTHEPFDFFCTNNLPDLHSLDSPPQKRHRFDSVSLDSLLETFNIIPNNNNNNNSNTINFKIPSPPPPPPPVIPHSELARQRRQKLSDKTRCLQKLLPWDTKMDTATMLEETHKYVKFLQAQIKALQSMPPFDFNDVGVDVSGVYGALGLLNRQQLLQVLLNSPVAQTWLSSQGCCVFSIEQLVQLKQAADKKAALKRMMFHGTGSF